jgi:glutamate-ammonia-ligase adenylyltransferase
MTSPAAELADRVDASYSHIERALATTDPAAAAALRAARDDPAQQLDRVLRGSEFLAQWAAAHAPAFAAGLASGELGRRPARAALAAALATAVAGAGDDDTFAAALRAFRDSIQAGIVYRLLAGIDDCAATVATCTDLAEAAIACALDWAWPRHCDALGEPRGSRGGEPQCLVVVAIGKLGAGELNLSSDIDLMFAWPEPGQTTRGHDNQQFMVRLVQRLIGLVGGRGRLPGAFRVDTRLRPFGNAGALALSFDALEDYLAEHGREWERFALMRARPLTGSDAARAAFGALVERFVYRRYVDYGAIEALRDMKRRIVRERGTGEDDVKSGAGGIREVEFIVQSLQLIYGGRDRRLRTPHFRQALAALAGGALDAAAARALDAAYVFLRDVEHHLQALRDEQTQRLPRTALDRQRLAMAFGEADYDPFARRLAEVRALVGRHFAAAVRDRDEAAAAADGAPAPGDTARQAGAGALWPPVAGDTPPALAALGYRDPAATFAALERLAAARDDVLARGEARDRLDRFVPRLLRAAAATGDADRAFHGTLPVIEAVLRRSVYLSLLNENATALAELVTLCGLSPVVADELARHPALLDDLIDPREWRREVARARYDAEVADCLARAADDDLEAQMDALRAYRRSQFLAIAAAALRGRLPLMRVSDAFTWLAEALLVAALRVAARAAGQRDGNPPILVVGYGKLGGLELAPRSDLDLVLLHDAGPDVLQRQHRTLQRFVHVLTALTREGRLYEIDMRLRPSGRDGLPLVALGEFERYQGNDAWTFEHQALLRARAIRVDGDAVNASLADRFDAIRHRILTRRRDPDALRADVAGMRARMRQGRPATDGDLRAGLKYGSGGIVDVEFVVQYLALAGAHEHPGLVAYSDNVRMLEAIAAAGLLPADDATALRDGYLALRQARHRLDLGAPVDAASVAAPRARVAAIHARVLGKPPGVG